MMDYLINVLIAARGYLVFAALLYVAYRLSPKESAVPNYSTVRKYVPKVAAFIAALGLFIGLSSPSNTPKIGVDYDKNADLRQLQRLDEQDQARTDLVVRDLSRQPQSAEERAQGAVDMRNRVKRDTEEAKETIERLDNR